MFSWLCGFAIIAWISAASWLGLSESGLHEYLAIVLGTTVIFLVGFLGLYFFVTFVKKSQ